MKQIRAVIFDLYGVLGLNGWQAFKLRHFADRPDEWERLRSLGQRVDAGTAEQAELVRALVEATGESEETVRYQFEHTVPNEALFRFIADRLKPAHKVGLLSNAGRDVFDSIFSPEQLALFDTKVSSYHVGLTKPDPQMYLLVCRQLGVAPDECIMVDDKLQHLTTAQELGMATILYISAEQVIRDTEKILTL